MTAKPTPEYLLEVFKYDKETGEVLWNVARSGIHVGQAVSRPKVKIDGKSYPTHVIVYVMAYGKWPEMFLDLKDGDPANTKLDNLREMGRIENTQHAKIRVDNTSGVKGVIWNQRENKWQARIQANRKRYSVGYFTLLKDACEAITAARKQLHGEFANNG